MPHSTLGRMIIGYPACEELESLERDLPLGLSQVGVVIPPT